MEETKKVTNDKQKKWTEKKRERAKRMSKNGCWVKPAYLE